MPRRLRVEYSGAVYPVMSRGDRREDIFLDDVDPQDFIKTLAMYSAADIRRHWWRGVSESITPESCIAKPPKAERSSNSHFGGAPICNRLASLENTDVFRGFRVQSRLQAGAPRS